MRFNIESAPPMLRRTTHKWGRPIVNRKLQVEARMVLRLLGNSPMDGNKRLRPNSPSSTAFLPRGLDAKAEQGVKELKSSQHGGTGEGDIRMSHPLRNNHHLLLPSATTAEFVSLI